MIKHLKLILVLITVIMFTSCETQTDGLTEFESLSFEGNQVQLLLDVNNGEKLQIDHINHYELDYYYYAWIHSDLNATNLTFEDVRIYFNGMNETVITEVVFSDNRRFLLYKDNINEITGLLEYLLVYNIPYQEFNIRWSEMISNKDI